MRKRNKQTGRKANSIERCKDKVQERDRKRWKKKRREKYGEKESEKTRKRDRGIKKIKTDKEIR